MALKFMLPMKYMILLNVLMRFIFLLHNKKNPLLFHHDY